MGAKAVLGSFLGLLLLAVAALAALYAAATVVASLVWGPTGARLATAWVATGLALTAGFSGYFVRKSVAGQVFPVDYDVSAAFRGGQGGL